jgi:hypothetical protein
MLGPVNTKPLDPRKIEMRVANTLDDASCLD